MFTRYYFRQAFNSFFRQSLSRVSYGQYSHVLGGVGVAASFGGIVLCDKVLEHSNNDASELTKQASTLQSNTEKDLPNGSANLEPSDGQLESVDIEPASETPKRPKWEFKNVPGNYAAVFIDEESIDKLKKRFPVDEKFTENQIFFDHMTVMYEPTETRVLEDDDLLTEVCQMYVLGIAKDEHCTALLVLPENPHINSVNKYPHITLVAEGGQDYSARYANILMHRLAAEPSAKALFRKVSNSKTDRWEGTLPPVPGIYPSTKATFVNLEDEQIVVNGVYCLKSEWDRNGTPFCTYKRENECSFCKFMKGGPCRKQFIAWEKCVNMSVDGESGDDFVDRCGNQTLDLKNCCDEHDYYNLLSGDNKDEDDESKENVVE